MLQPGIKAEKSLTVTDANTAKTMGSGTLDVFATPAMVALIEQTAYTSIESELEPGWGSVGTSLNIQHLSATPVGMTVTATTELVEVDRRRLVFHAEVYDEKGLVGKGTHERFLVENVKFQAKADAKNQ
ncbi:MAG: thioesterase family protein [Oscillospiraceae bacterium]|nr:thioesterase family protein [Oscillospiraceae bacterium]